MPPKRRMVVAFLYSFLDRADWRLDMQTLRDSRAAAIGTVVVLTGMVGLTLAGQQRSASTPTLKGVWRIAEIRYTGPNARAVTSPQPSMVIFTDKHVASVGVDSDTARQHLPPPDQ